MKRGRLGVAAGAAGATGAGALARFASRFSSGRLPRHDDATDAWTASLRDRLEEARVSSVPGAKLKSASSPSLSLAPDPLIVRSAP